MGQAKKNKLLESEYLNLLAIIGDTESPQDQFETAGVELKRFGQRFIKFETHTDSNEKLHQAALNSNAPFVQDGLAFFLDTFLSEELPCSHFSAESHPTTLLIACKMRKEKSHSVEIIGDTGGLRAAVAEMMSVDEASVHVWDLVLKPETFSRSVTALVLEMYAARNGRYEWMVAENGDSDTKGPLQETVMFAVTIDAPPENLSKCLWLDFTGFAKILSHYDVVDQSHQIELDIIGMGPAYSTRQKFAFTAERELVAAVLVDSVASGCAKEDTGIRFTLGHVRSESSNSLTNLNDIVFVMELYHAPDGPSTRQVLISSGQDAMFIIPHIIPLLRSSGYKEIYVLEETLDLIDVTA